MRFHWLFAEDAKEDVRFLWFFVEDVVFEKNNQLQFFFFFTFARLPQKCIQNSVFRVRLPQKHGQNQGLPAMRRFLDGGEVGESFADVDANAQDWGARR